MKSENNEKKSRAKLILLTKKEILGNVDERDGTEDCPGFYIDAMLSIKNVGGIVKDLYDINNSPLWIRRVFYHIVDNLDSYKDFLLNNVNGIGKKTIHNLCEREGLFYFTKDFYVFFYNPEPEGWHRYYRRHAFDSNISRNKYRSIMQAIIDGTLCVSLDSDEGENSSLEDFRYHLYELNVCYSKLLDAEKPLANQYVKGHLENMLNK